MIRGRIFYLHVPGTPVEVTGVNDVPVAGDKFMTFENEKNQETLH